MKKKETKKCNSALSSVLLEQFNALAEWNLKNINTDAEQVRKNIVTISEIIPMMVSLNHSVLNELTE